MIERVPGVGSTAFSAENMLSLARKLNEGIESFTQQLRSKENINLEQFAKTIQSLDKLSKQAEQC